MLIIAIGHGALTDPFSCSADPQPEIQGDDVKPYLDFICTAQNLQPDWVDEIVVVKNDNVVHFFGSDDGLGYNPLADEEPATQALIEAAGSDFAEEDDEADSSEA
jgi:hypothetical protein